MLVGADLPADPGHATIAAVAGSPRADEILLIDVGSATQAIVKVRVRINALIYVDYLTWHRIDGRWLITSKGFHLEQTLACLTSWQARPHYV